MTKRRRTVYLGLMVVGGMALAVDRCVLSDGAITPEQAMALDADRVSVHPAIPATTSTMSVVPVVPFPAGIDSYDPRSPLRNIFLPRSLDKRVGDAEAAPDKHGRNSRGSRDKTNVSSEVFTSTHRLIGVMLYDGLRIAIVDGLWLRIGQHVDGCVLQNVAGNQAQFRCGDEEAVLRVADNPTLVTD